ncbi:MAG: hypothetical protein JNL88_02745, partial [Bacteroidia bacterium]|nr:hypothetical protein [Bacteroidia bacterium]
MKKAPHAKKAGTTASSALDAVSGKFPVLYLLLVLFITALVFSGVSRLKWTNWDDDDYIYENRLVQEGDFAKIFSQPSANTYTPLVVSMFAMEWKLVKDKPLLYH